MAKENSSTASGGIGIFGLLGVAFVVMKLAGIGKVATWSWWWVTAPFWGGIALFISGVVIYLLVKIIIGVTQLIVKHFKVKRILKRIEAGEDVSTRDRLTAWWYVQPKVNKQPNREELKAKILDERWPR